MRTLQKYSKFSKRSLKERNLVFIASANFAKRFIQTSLMGKRGMWRIVEAVLAVLIVAGALLVILSKQETRTTEQDFYDLLRPALDEVAKDQILREAILNDDSSSVDAENDVLDKIKGLIPNALLEKRVKICDASNPSDCNSLTTEDKDVYSEERLITASLKTYSPKIVKVYIWHI